MVIIKLAPKATAIWKSMYSFLAPFLLFLIVTPLRIAVGSRVAGDPWKEVYVIVILVLVLLWRSLGVE